MQLKKEERELLSHRNSLLLFSLFYFYPNVRASMSCSFFVVYVTPHDKNEGKELQTLMQKSAAVPYRLLMVAFTSSIDNPYV